MSTFRPAKGRFGEWHGVGDDKYVLKTGDMVIWRNVMEPFFDPTTAPLAITKRHYIVNGFAGSTVYDISKHITGIEFCVFSKQPTKREYRPSIYAKPLPLP